jgi:hypothetical protein
MPDSEMPRYRCHKEVHALKILNIEPQERPPGHALIYPADEGFAPFLITPAYLAKHDPVPGGYYVVYDDGYLSYSPAYAFENGYTLIP